MNANQKLLYIILFLLALLIVGKVVGNVYGFKERKVTKAKENAILANLAKGDDDTDDSEYDDNIKLLDELDSDSEPPLWATLLK